MSEPDAPCDRAAGAVIVTLLATMLPLLLLVAAATTLMTGRNSALLATVQQTRALLAASAAIEDAAQSAQEGTLVAGDLVARAFAAGVDYEYVAVYLGNDGVDNDGDTLADEADERAFEVTAVGRSVRALERISAVIVEPAPNPAFGAAILTLGTPAIETDGAARVSGFDTRINGSRGQPVDDVVGIANEPPNDETDLRDNYTQTGISRVMGRGRSPSFGTLAAPYNLPGLVSIARHAATTTLPPGTFTSGLGSDPDGDFRTTYCPGDLHVTSARTGAGVLLVAGDLTLSGAFRWDGLIVVLGNLTVEGTVLVNGAVIQAAGADTIDVRGEAVVRYSTEALRLATANLPPIFLTEGWREVGR